MQFKWLFRIVAGSTLLLAACSHHDVAFSGSYNPAEYCEVLVERVERARVFDAMTWEAEEPLWSATFRVLDDVHGGCPKGTFVLNYQVPPVLGSLRAGMTLQIRRFECERMLKAKVSNILDWGTMVRPTDFKEDPKG